MWHSGGVTLACNDLIRDLGPTSQWDIIILPDVKEEVPEPKLARVPPPIRPAFRWQPKLAAARPQDKKGRGIPLVSWYKPPMMVWGMLAVPLRQLFQGKSYLWSRPDVALREEMHKAGYNDVKLTVSAGSPNKGPVWRPVPKDKITQKELVARVKGAQVYWRLWRLALSQVGIPFRNRLASRKTAPEDAGWRCAAAWEKTRCWFLRTTYHCGVDRVQAEIKKISTWARTGAVGDPRFKDLPLPHLIKLWRSVPYFGGLLADGPGGGSPRSWVFHKTLARLARLGRAGPECSDGVVVKQRAQHRLDLTRKLVSHPQRINALVNATSTLLKDLPHITPGVVGTALSGGACLELSRMRGGTRQALFEAARPALESMYEMIYGDVWPDAKSLPTTGSRNTDIEIVCQSALERVTKYFGVPVPVSCVVVKESGGKCRVVTKAPSDLVFVASCLRRCIWPLMEESRAIDLDQFGSELRPEPSNVGQGRLLQMFGGWYSADLTRASDLMPFDISQGIWGSICSHVGWDHKSLPYRVGIACLGPMNIEYPEDKKRVRSSSGILMGLPLTWIVLTFYNRATLQIISPGLGRMALFRGDDTVFPSTDRVSDAYERAITGDGGLINKAKSYRSAIGWTFAEQTYIVREWQSADLKYTDLSKVLDVSLGMGHVNKSRVPLKAERVPDAPIRYAIPRPQAKIPWFMIMGPSFTASSAQLVRGDRACFKRYHLEFTRQNAGYIQRARNHGLGVFVPRELGGFGLVHPSGIWAKGVKSSRWSWTAVALWATSSRDFLVAQKLYPVFQPFDLSGVETYQGEVLNQVLSLEKKRSHLAIDVAWDGTVTGQRVWDTSRGFGTAEKLVDVLAIQSSHERNWRQGMGYTEVRLPLNVNLKKAYKDVARRSRTWRRNIMTVPPKPSSDIKTDVKTRPQGRKARNFPTKFLPVKALNRGPELLQFIDDRITVYYFPVPERTSEYPTNPTGIPFGGPLPSGSDIKHIRRKVMYAERKQQRQEDYENSLADEDGYIPRTRTVDEIIVNPPVEVAKRNAPFLEPAPLT